MNNLIPRCLRASKTATTHGKIINQKSSSRHTISRQFTYTRLQQQPDTPDSPDARSPPSPQSTSAATSTQTEANASAPPAQNNAPNFTAAKELSALFSNFQANRLSRRNGPPIPPGILDIANVNSTGAFTDGMPSREEQVRPHHLHIYAHRHNCHITLTTPDRNPIISVSNGNIGFKKAGRKTFDSAFQLASYVMGRIRDEGLTAKIQKLEVTLRGFGAGREAVTKALLGTEGRLLRGKIVQVSDATRLKFGGTRSKAPRRLG